MRPVFINSLLCLALFSAGCGSIQYERARFDGNRIANPTLGRGVYYQIPDTYAVLNPWSPVPTKPENVAFETYLRRITALNDESKQQVAFRETLLFRAENRYLWIFHASMNLPGTFRGMHPGNRKLIMPAIAAESYRYFGVPQADFDYGYEQLGGRSLIIYKPFRLDARKTGEGWRGVGATVIGDVTDIMDVKIFAREADLPAAEADLKAVLAGFSYGKPLP